MIPAQTKDAYAAEAGIVFIASLRQYVIGMLTKATSNQFQFEIFAVPFNTNGQVVSRAPASKTHIQGIGAIY